MIKLLRRGLAGAPAQLRFGLSQFTQQRGWRQSAKHYQIVPGPAKLRLTTMAASAASIPHAFHFTNLIAAIPDFGLAGFFAISWMHPYAFGDRILSRLELIMLMEFIILHSSAFLAIAMTLPPTRILRIGAVIGLGLFYTMFVGVFSLSFHTWWPLASFWLLLINRMLAILTGRAPTRDDLGFIVAGWGVGVACYLGYAFLTAIVDIPRLGVTVAVLQAQHSSAGGLWADEPWRVIAFGVFYYATIAVTELFGIGAPHAAESQSFAAAR